MEKEQLFEFEAADGLLEGILAGGEVDVFNGVLQGAQGVFFKDIFRQGLFYLLQAQTDGSALQFAHQLAGDAAVLQFFRTRIYSGEAAAEQGSLRQRGIHFGMHHIKFSVEYRRLAEENKHRAGRQLLPIPSYPLEKYHLHLTGIILYNYTHPFDGTPLRFGGIYIYNAAVCAEKGAADHPRIYLHEYGISRNIGNAQNSRAVNIAEGVDAQQIPYGIHPKFGLQQRRPFGSHSSQILNIALEYAHYLSNIAIFL